MAYEVNDDFVEGDYSASLLGTISSHLEGLQGFDVMALELIQNADDAKAKTITFNITDDGLHVFNDGDFTYCQHLEKASCPWEKEPCDFHRIVKVASGGKQANPDNIGRFGIGFVSTYQITDHPVIESAGITVELQPETGKWRRNSVSHAKSGTHFFLPWAKDSDSEVRLGLKVSHITEDLIENLKHDFKKVLRKSLLFLRNVEKAEVSFKNNTLFGCQLSRQAEGKLKIAYYPNQHHELWYLMEGSIEEKLGSLYALYPKLELHSRNPKIAIALRLEPEPLDNGILYAYLPTEQNSGIPAHINADFFPESDRKAIILNGNQHQQAWNEQLIRKAATIISHSTTELLSLIGTSRLWFLIDKSHKTHNDKNTHQVFNEYWSQFISNCSNLRIAENVKKELCLPGELLLPDSKATSKQLSALQAIGCEILSKDLRPYWTVLQQFKAQRLNINLLTEVMQQYFSSLDTYLDTVPSEDISAVYTLLAEVVNQLLEQGKEVPDELRNVPFLITDDFQPTSLNRSYIHQGDISSEEIASNFKSIKLTGKFLEQFPNIKRLAKPLSLADLVDPISCLTQIEPDSFYKTLYEIDKHSPTDEHTYQQLHDLPIWISGQFIYKASEVLIPGGFKDPTGQAHLLNLNYFNAEMTRFVSEKIGMKTQELDTYICEVLPTIFTNEGPCDPDTYQDLIGELAKHTEVFDNPETKLALQSLKIIPTQNGGWAQPGTVYYKSDELTELLGNNKALWFDPNRVPTSTQVRNFITNLGVLEKARPSELVARLASIATNTDPSKENIAKSAKVFYQLCNDYDSEKPEYKESLEELRKIRCFPARKDHESWHHSSDLYAPFRAEGFESQAKILSYANTARLKTDVLKALTININPGTRLVIDHLLHCIENDVEPHVTTYQILNEKSNDEFEKNKISHHLANTACVYIKNKKLFLKKNQLYWIEPKLGKYAARIPEALITFRPFFNAIGVKDEPAVEDYVDILCDVIKNRTPLNELDPASEKIYYSCLRKITDCVASDDNALPTLEKLKQIPAVMTVVQNLAYPHETLLSDSPWHAALFPEEVKNSFCDFSPDVHPLLEHIGVSKLSRTISTRLGNTSGDKKTEIDVQAALRNKLELVLRMFDDEGIQNILQSTINSFSCFSYERLTVVAEIRSMAAISPPSESKAYFDNNSNSLYISRPFEDDSWVDVFTALFHSLMPASDTTEISKTAVLLSFLMPSSISLESAHSKLDSAGIVRIRKTVEEQEILSEDIDIFGDTDEISTIDEEPGDLSDEGLTADSVSSTSGSGIQTDSGTGPTNNEQATPPDAAETESTAKQNQPNQDSQQQTPSKDANGSGTTTTGSSHNWDQFNADNPDRERGDSTNDSHNSRSGQVNSENNNSYSTPQKRKRNPGETRKQRNQRFVSYLLPDTEVENRDEDSNEVREHNLAIEELAREAVCDYEALRGRLADQMSQTHPGYDIKSIEESGKERLIEVKGISGEWNQTGVGLSSYQFGQAKYHKDQYWLYVVEHVATQNQDIKIHPIQNPAQRVSSFMFDHGWKGVVENEKAKPQQPFIVGARVNAQGWGVGYIRKVEWEGVKKSMIIDFDKRGERRVTYRFGQITIVDEDDEPIDNTFAV